MVSAPSSATAGSAFNFTVTAQDQFNTTATGYTGTVHFSSSDGSATLPANSTLANGIGTFSATLNTAGNQNITASDTANSSITGRSEERRVGDEGGTQFTGSALTSTTESKAFDVTVTCQQQCNNPHKC